jgi:DNA-binding MarR family transcriptional regulator
MDGVWTTDSPPSSAGTATSTAPGASASTAAGSSASTAAAASAGTSATTSAGTADEVVGIVAAIRRISRRRLRGTVPGPILRGTQLELLRLVEIEPGIGVAAAARALHLAGNSVSTLVNQLVERGLLHRETDPDDRRAAQLRLTEQATTRLLDWRRARGQLISVALDRLPPADREAVAAALPAFRRLITELEETP